MGFDIVYDRQFIRTPRGVIPQVLIGCNNVWSGNRRARGWSNYFYGEFPVMTEEELLNRVERCCGKEFQEHFRRNGKFVDDNGLRRFVKDGIRQALTLEEIHMVRPHVLLRCRVLIYGDHYLSKLDENCATTKEFMAWLARAEEYFANGGEGHYDVGFTTEEPLSVGNLSPSRKVIAKNGGFYLCGIGDGVSYSRNREDALVFETLKEAAGRIPDWHIGDMKFANA